MRTRSNNRIRRSAALLAAVAIGGLTMGAGTAAADAGSADYLPAFAGLVPGLAAGSVGAELPTCDSAYGIAVREFSGVTAKRYAKMRAFPGEVVQSTISIESVADSETVERVTAYLPAGSKFLSVNAGWIEAGTPWVIPGPEPVTSVDKTTGAVTFTGSWPVHSRFIVQYSLPLTAKAGSVLDGGFGVTVTGLAPQDWPVLDGNDTTVVAPCKYDSDEQYPMPGGGGS
ncbi:hypothetical protein [Rhodococcus sp. NPDC059234]|uniref:hypothetical protein n=1 Tax=Rhodococcus sp. NPDC059234 TaxID=3346781 RepID=UPI00366C163E